MNPLLTKTINEMLAEYDEKIATLSKELRGTMGPNSYVRIQRDKVKAQQQTLLDLALRMNDTTSNIKEEI